MSSTTDPAADMAGHANAGDTANAGSSDIDAKINKAIGNWMKRLEAKIETKIPQLVESKLESMVSDVTQDEPAKPQPTAAAASGNDGERLTMKALQAQVDQLQKALKSQQEAAQQAEIKAKDTRLRSEFQSKLAAKIGADNPMLPLLLDSLYDKNKRVVEGANGVPLVKFVNTIGEEEFKTMDEGISTLFDTELKGLVNTSRTQQLPYAGYINRNQQNPVGQPLPTATQGNGQGRPNPLLMGVAEALSETRPEAAQIIAADAMKLSQQAPTPRK